MLQCIENSNALKVHNGIILEFYKGLSHVLLGELLGSLVQILLTVCSSLEMQTIGIASSPGHSQMLSRSRVEKSAEGLGSLRHHGLEMVLVQTESTLRTNRVHHFRSVT